MSASFYLRYFEICVSIFILFEPYFTVVPGVCLRLSLGLVDMGSYCMFEYGELLAEPLYLFMYNSGIPRQCMIPLLYNDAGGWA